MNVVGLSGTLTRPQGFRTEHSAGGKDFIHVFHVVEDADDRVVECVDKLVDADPVDPDPTKLAIEEMEDRGFEVIEA